MSGVREGIRKRARNRVNGTELQRGVREGIKDGGLKRMCSKLKRRLEGGLEIDG